MIESGRSHHAAGMPFPAPDSRTLEAARAGDTAALDAVITLCAPHVLRWCRRLGGPRADADDAAQDVLVVLFRRVRSVAVPEALGPWAFGITRRTLADHRRRAWFRRWVPGAMVDQPDPPRQERSLDAARVRAALEALPPAQREAFVLCDVEGHTDEESARLVSVPVGTLKSRLRLARARLHQIFPAETP